MKRKKNRTDRRHLTLSVAVMMLAMALGSCVNEPIINDWQSGKESTNITLELIPPGAFTLATVRAIEDESLIENAYVLIYKDGLMKSYTKGTLEGGKLSITLQTSQNENDRYDIVVATNLSENFAFPVGQDKAALRDKLSVNLPKGGKFVGPKFIMWGEVTNVLVHPQTNSFKIKLLRPLARMDVGVGAYNESSKTWAGLDDFSLTEVVIVNANSRYTSVPNDDAIDYNGTAIAPTMPPQAPKKLDPIIYLGEEITSGKYIQSTIYLAETYSEPSERITVVIGGSYQNKTTSYYRIDICVPKEGGGYDYLPILRNHLYRINIIGISGSGFGSTDEALKNDPINITAELNPIDEGGIGDIVFNGSNYIMTDISEIQFYGKPNGEYVIATVKAKFPPTSPATITGPGISGEMVLKASEVSQEIKTTIPEAVGTYEYTITTGRLKKIIKLIVQPPIDAHFDVLPFRNVAYMTITDQTKEKAEWVTLSPEMTYKKDQQQSEHIEGNSEGKAYIHFNENIITDDNTPPRAAQALIMRNNEKGKTRVYFNQLNLSGQVLGYFGGDIINNKDGYKQRLAIESIEEFTQRIYDDPSIGTIQAGMSWGFVNVGTNVTANDVGRPGTIILTERTGSGIDAPYTIYHNYAARYCFDKNRDNNGNGKIDPDEVVWYLPAQNQQMGIWIVRSGLINSPLNQENYWSSTELSVTQSKYANFKTGENNQIEKQNTFRVRCVRDL